MSIVDNMDRLVAWAEKEICSKVKFKLPDDDLNDTGYNYKLIHPVVFPMYMPSKDRLPPEIEAPFPSLCIQILDGKDMQSKGKMQIRFGISTWSTGNHGQDFFYPLEGEFGKYIRPDPEETKNFYERNTEGWRDSWNFVDTALRAIESTTIIDCLRIVIEDGVSFGAFSDQKTIQDYYPYWFAWIEFSVEYPITRNNTQYQDYL